MVFAKVMKAAAFAVVTASVLALGTTGGMAADAPAQKPTVWYKLCVDVPQPEPTKPGEQPKQQKPEEMKKVNVCLTQVDVRDNVTAMLIGKVAIRQIAGQEKPQLLAMLPLNSMLPPGAMVKIDDKEPVKLAYTTCDQGGCHAEAEVDPSFIAQMKAGKQIAYMGIYVTGRTLSVPLPLDDFAKAIDGKPVPVEQYNEEQKKIAEVIVERLKELREKQLEAQKTGGAAAPAAADPKKK